MITVFARSEPTTDEIVLKYGTKKAAATLRDVQIFHDAQATKPFARFGWHQSSKPTRRHRYVTLNCYRWSLTWLPTEN